MIEGLTGRLVFAIIASAFGSSFQHGYNTGVVNAPQALIEDWMRGVDKDRWGDDPSDSKITLLWSLAISIFSIGGMIGAMIAGPVSTVFGIKGGLLLNNILVLVCTLLEGLAKTVNSYEMIMIGRLIIGVNSGMNAALSPMYLNEISPLHLRGAIGTVYQLVITISIVISQALGLNGVLGTESLWPFLFAFTIVPGIFQVLTLPFCPESPKYLLIIKGRDEDAEKALVWLRGKPDVSDEINNLKAEHAAMEQEKKVTLKDMFVTSSLRKPLIIAMLIMVAQQFSGINAAIFFSTNIFKTAGLDADQSQYATLGMGAMNVLMTIVSLVLVDMAGRKTLLIIGFVGMCIDTILLVLFLAFVDSGPKWISYISIILVIMFVVMFATGPGSIPWFLVTELFMQAARPAATGLAVMINWAANFLVGLGFLPLQELMKGYVFIIFAALQAFFVFFIVTWVPETKNRPIEEITALFK